ERLTPHRGLSYWHQSTVATRIAPSPRSHAPVARQATAQPAGGASMTQTPTRPVPADQGAANQTGAVINKNAYAEAQDFLPLKGLDYVEFWVGNARQAAHYFRALLGFTPVAYSGLETGIRDRTSWVMKQNDITIVLTGALGPDGEIAEHVHKHGDGVHDI